MTEDHPEMMTETKTSRAVPRPEPLPADGFGKAIPHHGRVQVYQQCDVDTAPKVIRAIDTRERKILEWQAYADDLERRLAWMTDKMREYRKMTEMQFHQDQMGG